MDLRRPLQPLVRAAARLVFPIMRGLTLGVRALVLDRDGRVYLVSHTYVPGWHLPGGGVERGERLSDALRRELREEALLEPIGPPRLVGVFANFGALPTDHVALFEVRDWREVAGARRSAEISQGGFFAADRLPEHTTGATRRRIAEIATGGPVPDDW